MPLINYKPQRTILRTIDGQVRVWPPAPSFLEFGERFFGALTDEGTEAWNDGEDLEFYHVNAWGDLRGLARVEFA